jgi:hypothetical protein
MKLNSFSLAALVILLLFGGIGFTTAMNWWHTETTRIPKTYTEGDAAGQYNPADIRGSYTFGDVSQLFAVPLADLQQAFRIPAGQDAASFQVKSLEDLSAGLPVEVGTTSVRMFVAFYKGLPYDLAASTETYLFPEAAGILKAQGKMTPEQIAFLEGHLVPGGAAAEAAQPAAVQATPQPETAATPAPTQHVTTDRKVTGATTFQNLLDWGVTKEAIEKILGEAMPAPATVIKDYLVNQGLEFSSVKTQFQAAVDSVK